MLYSVLLFLSMPSSKVSVLVALIVYIIFIFWYIRRANLGESLYIRPISGLSSIDDAIGRATEMGRPVLFIPGIMDMDDIQTIAGISILGYVAEKVSLYNIPILVPTARSVVMTTAQETVREAYLRTGKLEDFREDSVFYLTDDQFGYTAGVDGIMIRERPAAIFLLGTFYAESLILAETGNSVGAIQIAGTMMTSQLPFFVAACDYTLIGEEFFAASAYLSRDPMQVASLKAQDLAKVLIASTVIIGIILKFMGIDIGTFLQKTGG